ncbi:CBS domain-containing protein [Pseudonocardia sp. CA-107938]|uniref:CBS domain-containing protein n=1 Tax=Pseudonocardia sp. CA-107938 TaxID=3240021 RepID=UPI003D8BD8C2
MRHATVADVMSTDLVWVRPTSSFAEVARLLHDAEVRAVPVLDDDRHLLGVVSEADLLPTVDADERPPHWWRPRRVRRDHTPRARGAAPTAADLMSTAVVTAEPDLAVAAAARRMHAEGVRWMPVVDPAGLVVGVLGRSDVLSLFLRDDDEIRREIVEDVLVRMVFVDPARVSVDVRGGVVTLTGELDTGTEVELTQLFTERVDGVVGVVNRLHAAVDEGAAHYGIDPLH